MAAQYDIAYRRLFSHPRLVADLLNGFVSQVPVDELDLTSLTPVRAKFVGSAWRVFEADQVWQLRHRPTGLPIYVQLEFQSRIDTQMPLRTVNYSVQLSMDVMRRSTGHQRGLPGILPVVVYNGQQRWTAPRTLRELRSGLPDWLERFGPSGEYVLLDIHATPLVELPLDNTVSYVIRLEQAGQPQAMAGILEELRGWLSDPVDEPLRRAFYEWLVYVSLPRGTRRKGRWGRIRNFDEGLAMLAERLKQWRQESFEEGRREGLQKGLKQGLEQGRAEGLLEGERQVLLLQLQRRFGRLSRAVRQRIQQADSAQLLQWAERLLTAQSLSQIFDGDASAGS
ncbi:MAG: hypothetical protein KatS3mg110_2999 [Pirellulaceae bacterium]|nr:MAG: hypothetical protein KatS3mg110_2999 [Pirellulaceae bacterium]